MIPVKRFVRRWKYLDLAVYIAIVVSVSLAIQVYQWFAR